MRTMSTRIGALFFTLALAAATLVVGFASPAGAANGCDSSQFPASPNAQSTLEVACHTDAGVNVNNVEIHDADNASWHHAAARSVTLAPASPNKATTAGSTTIKFAAGALQTGDLRHPINAYDGTSKLAVFKAGTFVVTVSPNNCTSTCTSATISQPAALTETSTSLKVEQTTNRVLADAVCSPGTNTLTSNTGKFTASDVNKSVTGGPFAPGTVVTIASSTQLTMNQTHAGGCTAGHLVSIGAQTFSAGNPVLFNGDPMSLQLSNSKDGGAGFTCTGGNILGMTTGSKTDTGGFNAGYIGLSVTIKVTAGTTTTSYVTPKITAVSTAGNTSATLAASKCPTLPTPDLTHSQSAAVGVADAIAPANSAPMMSLGAQLNLNPTLLKTEDDCTNGTFEGITIVGDWVNPGSYAASTAAPKASVGQVQLPTAVISFYGFVVPRAGGDTTDASPHYDLSFPVLPTSSAVCLSSGLPSDPTELTFTVSPRTLTLAPILPSGSGNPNDPQVRTLLPETGSFSQTIQLITNPSTVVATSISTPCVIGAATTPPGLPCGDG